MADTLIASLRAQLVMDTQGAERLLSLVRTIRMEAKDAQDRLGRGSIWPHTSEFGAAKKVRELGESVTALSEKFVRVQEAMRQTGAPQEALTANTLRFARTLEQALKNVDKVLDGTKRDMFDYGKAFQQAGVGFKGILPDQQFRAVRKEIRELLGDLDALDRKYTSIAKKVVSEAASVAGGGLLGRLFGKGGAGFGGFTPQDAAAVRELTAQMGVLTGKLSEVAAAHQKIAQNASSVIRAEFNVTAAVNVLADSVHKLDVNLTSAAQRMAALEKASNGATKLGRNLADISNTEALKRETVVLADRAKASEALAASYDKLTSAQSILSAEAARLNAAMDGPVRKSKLLRDTMEALKSVSGSTASIGLIPTQLAESITSLARSGSTNVLAAQYTRLAEAQERLNKSAVAVNAAFKQAGDLKVLTGRSLESYVAGIGQGLKAPFQAVGDLSSAAAGAVEGATSRVRAAFQQWSAGGLERLNASQLRQNAALTEAARIASVYAGNLKEVASQEAVRLSQLERLEAAERARARAESELAAQSLRNEKAKRDEMAKTAQFREQMAQNEVLRANAARNAESEAAAARERATRQAIDDAARLERAKASAKVSAVEEEKRRAKELADYELELAKQVARAKQEATKLSRSKDALTFGVANSDAYKEAQAREASAQAALKDAQSTKALTQARLEHARVTKMDEEIKKIHAQTLGLNADQATRDAIATAKAAVARNQHTAATNTNTAANNANARSAQAAAAAGGGWGAALGAILPHLQSLNALSTLATGNLGLWLGRLASLGTMSQQASVGMIASVGAMSALVTTISRFGSEAVRVAKSLEPIEQLLNLIRPAGERVNESFNEFARVSLKYGLAIEQIARPLARFKIASEGTAASGQKFREMMEDVAAISSKFALTQDAIAGMTKALEQMMSKGTVQAEEFRQQLGDRLPAAARVGLLTFRQLTGDASASMADFLKAMEKRQIISEIFVPTFLAKFRELYGITLEGTNNIVTAQGRLSTSWDLFIRNLDKSIGYTRAYTSVLNTLSGGLQSLGQNAELLNVLLTGIGSTAMVAVAAALARNYAATAAAAAASGAALGGLAAAAQTAKAGLAGVLVAGSAFMILPGWIIGAGAALGGLVFAVGRVRAAIAAAGAGASVLTVGLGAVAGGVVAIRTSLGAALPLLARFGTLGVLIGTAFLGAYSAKLNDSLNEALKTVQENKERIAREGMPEIKFVVRKDSLNDARSLIQDVNAYVMAAADRANLVWSDSVGGFVQRTAEQLKRAGRQMGDSFKLKPSIELGPAIDEAIAGTRARIIQLRDTLALSKDRKVFKEQFARNFNEAVDAALSGASAKKIGENLLLPESAKKMRADLVELTQTLRGLEGAKTAFASLGTAVDAAGLGPKFEYLKTQLTTFEQAMLSIRPVFATLGPAAQVLGVAISGIAVAAAAGVPVVSGWVAGLAAGSGVLAMLARRAGIVGIAITALGISMAAFSDPAKAATKDVKALSEELDRVMTDRTREGLVKLDPAQSAIAAVQAKLTELRVAQAQVRHEMDQALARIQEEFKKRLGSASADSEFGKRLKTYFDIQASGVLAQYQTKLQELSVATSELDAKNRNLTAAMDEQRKAAELANIEMARQNQLREQARVSWEELEQRLRSSTEQLATMKSEGYAAAQAQREIADEVFRLKATIDSSGKSVEEWTAKLREIAAVQREIRAEETRQRESETKRSERVTTGYRAAAGAAKDYYAVLERADDIIAGVGLREANKFAKMRKDLAEYEDALRKTGVAEEELKGKVQELTLAFQMQAAGINLASLAFKPLQAVQRGLESFADSIADLLTSGQLNFKSFGEAFKKMALSISKEIIAMVIKMAVIKPIMQGLFGGMQGMFGSGGLNLGGLFGGGSGVTAFAKGGVVDQPTFFGTQGGRMNVMGEAGSEAILPLARGPGGRLGVAMHGDGGGSPTYNITFNVQSNDPASFARSETQIAAMLSRTVGRGNRNL